MTAQDDSTSVSAKEDNQDVVPTSASTDKDGGLDSHQVANSPSKERNRAQQTSEQLEAPTTISIPQEDPSQRSKRQLPSSSHTSEELGHMDGTPTNLDTSQPTPKRRRRDETPLFLEKLYDLVENCPNELAGWSPNGDSFVVHDPTAFTHRVIPQFFKHKNFSSFVRQLNLYGFRKLRGVDGGGNSASFEFHHDKFMRGDRDSLKEIRRRSVSNADSKPHTIDRTEMEELRSEVSGLRSQIQQLNKQMINVMQVVAMRNQTCTDNASNPSTPMTPTLPSLGMHCNAHPHTLLQLSQGLASPIPSATGNGYSMTQPSPVKVEKRTPASTYQLRPLHATTSQSQVPAPLSSPLPSYLPTSSDKSSSVPDVTSHLEAAASLKRIRENSLDETSNYDWSKSSGNAFDEAVRRLSQVAHGVRMDLLKCVTARILGFIRLSSPGDASAVSTAVESDIKQKLANVQEESAPDGNSESACMYRVEILKHLSRELPRAVHEAVEKKLPTEEKQALDRSLLAQLVQRAQSALEAQMHEETKQG